MIIFLHGADDYRREERKRFYLSEYEKKHLSFGVGRFDMLEDSAFERFQDFTANRSIFDVFKLALLENVFESGRKELIEALKELTKAGREITILISEEKAPKEFSFLLKAPVIAEVFEPLSGYEWEVFVRKKAREYNVKLSPEALDLMKDVYEGQGWRLVTELQKLGMLDQPHLEVADLERFDVEIAPDFWGLMLALKNPDQKRRLTALERLLGESEPPAKIFNILSAQWPQKLGEFAQGDLMVKSGKLEYEEVLLGLVLR